MGADESINIETTSTRLVCENRWMPVREDTIRRRDGSTGIYGVAEKPDFVVIVPVEDDCRVHLLEQYRYPVKGRYWELPQGSSEQEPGVDPMEMARGELREETGRCSRHSCLRVLAGPCRYRHAGVQSRQPHQRGQQS
jgi:hypothetical protein